MMSYFWFVELQLIQFRRIYYTSDLLLIEFPKQVNMNHNPQKIRGKKCCFRHGSNLDSDRIKGAGSLGHVSLNLILEPGRWLN